MTATELSIQLSALEHSLLKYANRLSQNSNDAKDLLQETLLKVLLNREKFVDTGFLKAWTFTIMKNTFINNYRRNVLQKTFSDSDDMLLFIDKAKTQYADDPHSVYSVIEINQTIEQLNNKFRVPIKMYIDGYKYKEIADMINLKLGTVKSRIFIARKMLVDQMGR